MKPPKKATAEAAKILGQLRSKLVKKAFSKRQAWEEFMRVWRMEGQDAAEAYYQKLLKENPEAAEFIANQLDLALVGKALSAKKYPRAYGLHPYNPGLASETRRQVLKKTFPKGTYPKEVVPNPAYTTMADVAIRGRQHEVAWPRNLPKYIDVDGVKRPTANALGRPIAPDEESIRNFWRWFGDSQTVDEQGRPLVFFHGTDQDFSVFNPRHLGETTKAKSARKAFFFTDNPSAADFYAAPEDSLLVLNMLKEVGKKYGIETKSEVPSPQEAHQIIDAVSKAVRAPLEGLSKGERDLLLYAAGVLDVPEMNPGLPKPSFGLFSGAGIEATSSPTAGLSKEAFEFGRKKGLKLSEAKRALARERVFRLAKEDPSKADLPERLRALEDALSDYITVVPNFYTVSEMSRRKSGRLFNDPDLFVPDWQWKGGAEITPNIMPVYVRSKNLAISDPEVFDRTYKGINDTITDAFNKGADATMIRHVYDPLPMNQLAVKPEPTNIKSAIGNRGTFDPWNPDITKALAGAAIGAGAMLQSKPAQAAANQEETISTRRGRNLVRAGVHATNQINQLADFLNRLAEAGKAATILGFPNPAVMGLELTHPGARKEILASTISALERPLYMPELYKKRHDIALNWVKEQMAQAGMEDQAPSYLPESAVEAVWKQIQPEPELRSVSDEEWKQFQEQQYAKAGVLDQVNETIEELYNNPITRPFGAIGKLGKKVFDLYFSSTEDVLDRIEGAKPIRAGDAVWVSLEVTPFARSVASAGKAAIKVGARAAGKKMLDYSTHAAFKHLLVDQAKDSIGWSASKGMAAAAKNASAKLRNVTRRVHLSKGDVVDLLIPEFNSGNKVVKGAPIVGLRKVATIKDAPLKVKSADDAADLAYRLIGHHAQENALYIIADEKTGKVEGVIRTALGAQGSVDPQPVLMLGLLDNWPSGKGKKALYMVHNHPGGIATPSQGDIDVFDSIKRLLFATDLDKRFEPKALVIDSQGRWSPIEANLPPPPWPKSRHGYYMLTKKIQKAAKERGEVPIMERKLMGLQTDPFARGPAIRDKATQNVIKQYASGLKFFISNNKLDQTPGVILLGPGRDILAFSPLTKFAGTYDASESMKRFVKAATTVNPMAGLIWVGDVSGPSDFAAKAKEIMDSSLGPSIKNVLDTIQGQGTEALILGRMPDGSLVASSIIDISNGYALAPPIRFLSKVAKLTSKKKKGGG